LSYLY
jgi:hypothetical protein